MKTPNFTLILSALFFTVFCLTSYVACNQQEENPTDFSIKQAKSLVDEFNLGKLEEYHGEYLMGSVKIYPIENQNKIDFFVTTNDKRYIHYILQMEAFSQLQDNLENAEILFFNRFLVINSLDTDKRILVNIENNKYEPLQNIEFTMEIKGFGLARTEKTADGKLTSRASVNCECCITGEGCGGSIEYPSECDSGGSAAVSCSLSSGGESCSVQCSGGYHACCRDD